MTRRFWPNDTWYCIRKVTRLVGTERWGMPPGPVTSDNARRAAGEL